MKQFVMISITDQCRDATAPTENMQIKYAFQPLLIAVFFQSQPILFSSWPEHVFGNGKRPSVVPTTGVEMVLALFRRQP